MDELVGLGRSLELGVLGCSEKGFAKTSTKRSKGPRSPPLAAAIASSMR